MNLLSATLTSSLNRAVPTSLLLFACPVSLWQFYQGLSRLSRIIVSESGSPLIDRVESQVGAFSRGHCIVLYARLCSGAVACFRAFAMIIRHRLDSQANDRD